GIDNDCDNDVDEGIDYDSDGYPAFDCAGNPVDCNDNVWWIHPGANENCDGEDGNCDGISDSADTDGDGYPHCQECNDNNAAAFPGATEVCDNADNDCDGYVDEVLDLDGDGYPPFDCAGNPSDCDDSNYYIHPNVNDYCNGVDEDCDGTPEADGDGDGFYACDDCDDANPAINPVKPELCDGFDNNCDGVIDERMDMDGDGFPGVDCSGNVVDCNDFNWSVNPTATEVCDGLDGNCDGIPDLDEDGDGYLSCQDCDDSNAAIFAFAPELCDGFDNDCDGSTDERLDSDGDGFVASDCAGEVIDCNDNDPSVYPGALEFCNDVDDNCDGKADDLISSITPTAQTCPILMDGTISIVAHGAGQVRYSITGGAYFQLTGNFLNLQPGTYQVVVEMTDPPICSQTATVTIAAAPQSALKIWKKDLDNDGYTDGITTQACDQPTGYKLTALAGDCNDNDPLQFPGQNWYKDSDNDGYSNGTKKVQCTKPSGYKAASQLYATSGDCNDAKATVYPGAPELCNGSDENCNGIPDDGAPVGGTFNGNVALTSQAQVNNFAQCYSVINGHLTIQNSSTNSLSSLVNLTQVTGNVTIKSTSLQNLNGLNNLTSIGGKLTIQLNNFGSKLKTLQGLENLASVGGNLQINNNLSLSDCCPIHDLINGGVGGTVVIVSNKTGCESVAAVNVNCAAPNAGTPPVGDGTEVVENEGFEAIEAKIPGSPETAGEFGKQGFELFPNPASGQVAILLKQAFSAGRIYLYDLQGRLVLQADLEENVLEFMLDLSRVPQGSYLVRASVDGEQFSRILIVE
ncbi:MAG: MopE-related protein, partial [Bacteroidota bacterium]